MAQQIFIINIFLFYFFFIVIRRIFAVGWVWLGSELNFAGGSGWVGFKKLWVGLGQQKWTHKK